MDDDEVDKKAKGTKKCVIKRYLIFNNYEESLEEKNKVLRSQQRFKNDGHNVYTEAGVHLARGSRGSGPLPFFDTVQIVPSNS